MVALCGKCNRAADTLADKKKVLSLEKKKQEESGRKETAKRWYNCVCKGTVYSSPAQKRSNKSFLPILLQI